MAATRKFGTSNAKVQDELLLSVIPDQDDLRKSDSMVSLGEEFAAAISDHQQLQKRKRSISSSSMIGSLGVQPNGQQAERKRSFSGSPYPERRITKPPSPTDTQSMVSSASAGQTAASSKKSSLPAQFPSVVNEAMELAGLQMGKQPSLRKISLVQRKISPSGEAGAGAGAGAGGATEEAGRRFFRKKKAPAPEESKQLVFAFRTTNGEEEEEEEEDEEETKSELGLQMRDAPSVDSETNNSVFLRECKSTSAVINEVAYKGPGIKKTPSMPVDLSESGISSSASYLMQHLHHRIPSGDLDVKSNISYVPTLSSLYDEDLEEEIIKKQEMKETRFWDFFTMVSSITYAIGVLNTGIVIYLSEVFIQSGTNKKWSNVSEYFNIYLSVFGILWLVWLQIDIGRYVSKIKKHWEEDRKHDGEKDQDIYKQFEIVENSDGELTVTLNIAAEKEEIPQYYGFSTGRHSGSFYLKVGSALFCLGHLIHIGLNLGKQIVFFTAGSDGEGCESILKLIFSIVHPMYSFLQLYVIFKYSNVIVNRKKGLARFAFMHCITSSLCFWINTIVYETLDSIVAKTYFDTTVKCKEKGEDNFYGYYNATGYGIQDEEDVCYTESATRECLTYQNKDNAFDYDINCLLARMCQCADNNDISRYAFQIGSYLYPFSIEFSILVVGIWYIMWSNIGKVRENRSNMEFLPSQDNYHSLDHNGNHHNEAMFISADCHSSNKGLFGGLFYLVVCIIGVIISFILLGSEDCDQQDLGKVVHNSVEFFLLSSMIIATIWVYYKMSDLDVNPNPISLLDDMLLFLCMPSFFLYMFVNVIPLIQQAIGFGRTISMGMMLLQVILQTPMIVDGLRRCSDTSAKQTQRPGKNLLTFLLICNLAIYFWDTMEVKNFAYQKPVKQFYGDTLWTLLSHVTLPLCIFYRFHSSVALADIWNSAYKPGNHH